MTDILNTKQYFVSHYETVYPTCRLSYPKCRSDDLVRPSSNPCYKSNCDFCTAGCDTYICNLCTYRNFDCITTPCPQETYKLSFRVGIGVLTDEEKECLAHETGIVEGEKKGTILEYNLSLNSTTEKYQHKQAIESFDETTDDSGGRIYCSFPDYIQFMMRCQQIADKIRETREMDTVSVPIKTVDIEPETIHVTAASGKGNRQTTPVEIDEVEKKTALQAYQDSIEDATEPAQTRDEPVLQVLKSIDSKIENLTTYKPPSAPFDESKGKWTPVGKAAKILGYTIGTLENYRMSGEKTDDRKSGIDKAGNRWKNPTGRKCFYWIQNDTIPNRDNPE